MIRGNILNKKIYRFLSLFGIIGPIFFLIVITAIGFLHPNYNHITQYISELGAANAPYSLIMNTIGFPLLGLFIIAFSVKYDYQPQGRYLFPSFFIIFGIMVFELSGNVTLKNNYIKYGIPAAAIVLLILNIYSVNLLGANYNLF